MSIVIFTKTLKEWSRNVNSQKNRGRNVIKIKQKKVRKERNKTKEEGKNKKQILRQQMKPISLNVSR